MTFFLEEAPPRKAVPAGETAAEQPMSAELATDPAEVGELAARPVAPGRGVRAA